MKTREEYHAAFTVDKGKLAWTPLRGHLTSLADCLRDENLVDDAPIHIRQSYAH